MEVKEISSNEYLSVFTQHNHLYNTVQYNVLNEKKCEKIVYLLFFDNKVKLGLIAGIKDGVLTSPFSAPFGGFSSSSNFIRIEKFHEAIQLLDEYARQNGIKGVKFILPPYFYDDDFLYKTIYSLTVNGYTTIKDINYHFKTSEFNAYQENIIDKRSKEFLKKATKAELTFRRVDSEHEKHMAYKIVKDNRARKDRPMYVSYEHIIEVNKIIPIDFFLVFNQDTPIASAIVYHVSKKVLHVVFWGDVPDFNDLRPMYFVAFKLFEFYHNKGCEIIDLTTGSVDGIPNFGLCHFKENIGCTTGLKYTMHKTIL
jgi:hypothetical protein